MYFKVIRTITRESAIYGGIIYTPKEWVKAPKGTGLFVFKSMERAMDFIRYNFGDLIIVKCDVKNPRRIDYVICGPDINNVHEFWSNGSKNLVYTDLYIKSAPSESFIADEVYCHE